MKLNKKVYIEDGYSYYFDSAKFNNIIKLKAKEKGITIKEYIEFLAIEISNSPDTVLGWKKGKNSPVDIDIVYKLEKLLDVSHKKLLFSKEKQLEKKIKKIENEKAELVGKIYILENSKKIDLNNDVKIGLNPVEEKYNFYEEKNEFSLRYNGFSNLIDLLIGHYKDTDKREYVPSTYAEMLSYILSDYICDYSLAELAGFKKYPNREEIQEYIAENKDISDEDICKWAENSVKDANGNRLYDDNGDISINGIELLKNISNSELIEESDLDKVKLLVDELIKRWNDYEFPYASISISIKNGDLEIKKYTFGDGFILPTNYDRMDIITKLLFFTNGDIDKYALQNVKKLYVDQFEEKVIIEFDLLKLI